MTEELPSSYAKEPDPDRRSARYLRLRTFLDHSHSRRNDSFVVAATLVGVATGVSSIVGHTVFTVPWGLLASTILSATVLVSVASVLTALARTRSPAIEVARARE